MSDEDLDYIEHLRFDGPLSITTALKIVGLVAEVRRLRRGDFTPEEFQNLCHHRDQKPGCTRQDFEEGCRQYQAKLFGSPE